MLSSRIKGVHWCKSANKWRAMIWNSLNQKVKHIGLFTNEKEAQCAYREASRSLALKSKLCTICGKTFATPYARQNTCSFECRCEKRRLAANQRCKDFKQKIKRSCLICGYNKTTDRHHENGKEYILCPNCHALVTRGISKLEELFNEAKIFHHRSSEAEGKPN